LSSPTNHPELSVAHKLEVFVTGDDVELDGVDDPNDTTHYLYIGTFSKFIWSGAPVSKFQLWSVSTNALWYLISDLPSISQGLA
jgi:hypothetical protein